MGGERNSSKIHIYDLIPPKGPWRWLSKMANASCIDINHCRAGLITPTPIREAIERLIKALVKIKYFKWAMEASSDAEAVLCQTWKTGNSADSRRKSHV
jgi:hypothetical protein